MWVPRFAILIGISLWVSGPLDAHRGTPETNLTVVDAGIEDAEDAAPVASSYRFLPGEYLYFTFQVAGFTATKQGYDTRRISLTFEVDVLDNNGLALVSPESGKVDEELNPEDKSWTPRRHVSFLIPSFIASGEFHIHVHVKDVLANTETAKDYPFLIGGVKLQPAATVTAENFRFLRNENDREALPLAAYRAGDTIFVRFELAGYKVGPRNQYHVAYGMKVLRPDGRTFFEDQKAAELKSEDFYPAQFVPGNLAIMTTPDTSSGPYTVVLTVRDLLSGNKSQVSRLFQIE